MFAIFSAVFLCIRVGGAFNLTNWVAALLPFSYNYMYMYMYLCVVKV